MTYKTGNADDPIRLLAVRDTPLFLDEVYAVGGDDAVGDIAAIAAVSCPHRTEEWVGAC
ncbi:hypothetical protein [Streptomyces sp. NPDC059593]|uniref:hypothetical protein n=1 Tax=Streptomyces sp. NPDC059593 TaxID=3346878 RepID=UPI00367B5E80